MAGTHYRTKPWRQTKRIEEYLRPKVNCAIGILRIAGMRHFVILGLIAAASISCAATAAVATGLRELSQPALRKLLIGSVIPGGFAGQPFTEIFRSNGLGYQFNGDVSQLVGTYSFSGAMVCVSAAKKAPRCRSIKTDGKGNFFQRFDGDVSFTPIIVKSFKE